MSSNVMTAPGKYALATGAQAVGRLHVLHEVYGPAGLRFLLHAGLREGMRVADFGCGVGVVTRTLADVVGPDGFVTGIDVNAEQVEEAAALCAAHGFDNVDFVEASAVDTGLFSESFDLVYCRFLLLHLTDPEACLREMRRVLKPRGLLVIEDGDLTSAGSVPPTAFNAFSSLWNVLGPIRKVDYSISNRLYHLVREAGFSDVNVEIHQPAEACGPTGMLLKWSVREAGHAFIEAGLISPIELQIALDEMEVAHQDPNVLALGPRMTQVSARK